MLFIAAIVCGVALGQSTLPRYLDQTAGMTADEAVRIALENNGDLIAMRKERDAAKALIDQARLRANPSLELSGMRQISGMDKTYLAKGSLPLELGGRRSSRILVAKQELAVKEESVNDRERLLATEVRMKFGEALAATLKLKFTEDTLESSLHAYRLVQARVTEGKIAPLEESMTLVEVNRLRSIRETTSGKTEIAFLELRNLLGMMPEAPLRLRGNFDNLVATLPNLADTTADALLRRPDLAGLRAIEDLANAQIEQTKAQGRVDASLMAGYQSTKMGFPFRAFDEAGNLQPIVSIFNYYTFGITLQLPVRNRNQGNVSAAVEMREAARNRREFGELIVRSEVASAYARYESAAKAMEIFRVGVRGQANTNLDVLRQTYELGSRNLIEYLIEERRYIEIENEFIDMQLAVYNADVELMRAANLPDLIRK
ncbi:MAG: TolC family protein [Pyrinomonadaceae bacterium]